MEKMESLTQSKSQSCTDALIKALETADDMDGVLILYYAKEGRKGHCHVSEDMKSSDCLWIIEQYKAWLLGLAKRDSEIDR